MFDPILSFAVLFFNIGSRNITFNFTEGQKALFKHPIFHALVLFAMFYVSTRSLGLALILTIVYYLLIHIFLNESSHYSVLHHLVQT